METCMCYFVCITRVYVYLAVVQIKELATNKNMELELKKVHVYVSVQGHRNQRHHCTHTYF